MDNIHIKKKLLKWYDRQIIVSGFSIAMVILLTIAPFPKGIKIALWILIIIITGKIIIQLIFPETNRSSEIIQWALAYILGSLLTGMIAGLLVISPWGINRYSFSIAMIAILSLATIRLTGRSPNEKFILPIKKFENVKALYSFGLGILLIIVPMYFGVIKIERSQTETPIEMYVTGMDDKFDSIAHPILSDGFFVFRLNITKIKKGTENMRITFTNLQGEELAEPHIVRKNVDEESFDLAMPMNSVVASRGKIIIHMFVNGRLIRELIIPVPQV